MRYGIIADIHSNQEALEKVLLSLSKEVIDKYLCLGDIVGYGADPQACVNIIKDLNPLIVLGNHDAGCIGKLRLEYFNDYAKKAIIWTQGKLDKASSDYIENFKLIHEEAGTCLLVHGTLDAPGEFNYMINGDGALRSLGMTETRVLFVGHTHVPGIFECRERVAKYFHRDKIRLKKNSRYVINAGSVGQPRDGDPRASYVIYDTENNKVEMRKVAYDVEGVRAKIIGAGLPHFLGYRLLKGI